MANRRLCINHILDAVYGVHRLMDKEQLAGYRKLHRSYGKEFCLYPREVDASLLADAIERSAPTPGSRPKVVIGPSGDGMRVHVEFPMEGTFMDSRSEFYDSDFDGLVQILRGAMGMPSSALSAAKAEADINGWARANGFLGVFGAEAKGNGLSVFPRDLEASGEMKSSGMAEILVAAGVANSAD